MTAHTLPRRRTLRATTLATALAATLTISLTGPLTAPAVAETGLNNIEKDDWLPLTVDPGAPLPDDPFLDTDDCPFADDLPPAFDEDALPSDGEDAPAPLTVEHPGPAGEALDTCAPVSVPGMEVPDRLSLGSYLVYDVDSGDILAAKDPYGLYRPASIIKALLVMTALDELDLDQVVPVSDEAVAIDGSQVGVGPGGRYTARELLLGLVMRSGNDAAIALSEAMGGQDETVKRMQDLADSLGTQATRVMTVHGLDSAGVQTTAYDMALIYRAAFQREDVRELLGEETTDFPGYGDMEGFELSSDNEMLFNYPGTIGGKTGFTDNARHTFSVAAERDGRKLGMVLLNSTIAAGRPAEQASAVLDAAFDAPAGASIGTLDTPADDAPAEAGDDGAAQPQTSDVVDGDTSDADGIDMRAIVGAGVAVLLLLGLAAGAARFRRR
ncbi:D-alanyl-D-alanine carboxypeptidase family protein [Corynebacterium glyciniphilum]|uniref:D-alanyl-D-alanine carboxypeptidase family protein n=1 Tax=Corynebacterium glyciniphilum TaxID=1404244 RepID=UPI003FD51BCD